MVKSDVKHSLESALQYTICINTIYKHWLPVVALAVTRLLRHLRQQKLGDGRLITVTRLLGVSLTSTSTECAVLVDLDPARDDNEGGQLTQQLQAARLVATGVMLNAEGLKKLVEEHQVKQHGRMPTPLARRAVKFEQCQHCRSIRSAQEHTVTSGGTSLMHGTVPHASCIPVYVAMQGMPPYHAACAMQPLYWHRVSACVPGKYCVTFMCCPALPFIFRLGDLPLPMHECLSTFVSGCDRLELRGPLPLPPLSLVVGSTPPLFDAGQETSAACMCRSSVPAAHCRFGGFC